MTFLAPYMLWGSLAAGIPIALHFFFRSRYRVVPWAAMKFLLTSIEQTSRRLRFQELLLLLMRIALLVLLALALARPLSSVIGGAGQGEAVDAVFVIDTSYSMSGSDGTKTRLQQASEAALGIINQLPPHSTVQIVGCADRAEVLGPRSPADLERAREILKELKPTSLSTELSWGVVEAASLLARGQASNKELYIVSDMQKQGWQRQAGKIRQTLENLKDTVSITVVHAGSQKLKNAAILGIAPQTGVPRPGERVGFAVLVRNTGAEPLENVEIALSVDGDAKAGGSQVVKLLSPNETRAVTLTGKMGDAGLRQLSAVIKHDDLSGDNRFDQVILVRDYVNVLVVDGEPNQREPELSASYFLMHALIPVKESDRARHYLQPRMTSPRLASPALLENQDLCILTNVSLKPNPGKPRSEALPEDFVNELARFVRRGHGLIIFAGDEVDPEVYNQILGQKHDLLPMPIHKKLLDFPVKDPLGVARKTFQLPAYSQFKDDDDYKGFSEVEVYKALDLDEPPADPDAQKAAIIIAGDLPAGTTPADFSELFGSFGKVASVEFLKEPPPLPKTGQSPRPGVQSPLKLRLERGQPETDEDSARVVMESGALKALEELDGRDFKGHPLQATKPAANPPVVALRFANNKPAVVTRKVGDGEVILVATAASTGFDEDTLGPSWTDFPLRLNLYVPFVDVTVNHLLHGQAQTHNVVAGQTLVWKLDKKNKGPYDLVRPDHTKTRLALPGEGQSTLSISDMPDAGIYYLEDAKSASASDAAEESDNKDENATEGDESKQEGDVPTGDPAKRKSTGIPLAVIPDLRESDDLQSLTGAELVELLGFEPHQLQAGSAQAADTGTDRLNREWTHWLLLCVLGLTMCESLLAYWCGRSW